MFKQQTIFSIGRIPHRSKCLNHNTSNKEDSEGEEEDLVEEEDEVVDFSSATIVGYLDITSVISHIYSVHVHTAPQLIILLRNSHN